MIMNDKFAVIDADAHVVETERVWDYLEGADRRRIPNGRSGFSTAKISAASFLPLMKKNQKRIANALAVRWARRWRHVSCPT